MTLITIALWLVAIYLIIGIGFGAWFVSAGVKQIDEAAASPTIGFRVLIFPGCVALWPVMLRRWAGLRGKAQS